MLFPVVGHSYKDYFDLCFCHMNVENYIKVTYTRWTFQLLTFQWDPVSLNQNKGYILLWPSYKAVPWNILWHWKRMRCSYVTFVQSTWENLLLHCISCFSQLLSVTVNYSSIVSSRLFLEFISKCLEKQNIFIQTKGKIF